MLGANVWSRNFLIHPLAGRRFLHTEHVRATVEGYIFGMHIETLRFNSSELRRTSCIRVYMLLCQSTWVLLVLIGLLLVKRSICFPLRSASHTKG